MTAARIRERSLVIASTALCMIAAGIAWAINPGELTLPLALLALVPPVTVALARILRNGLVDPLAVFALCFAAYNGVLLVRMNYGVEAREVPFATDGSMLFHAGILSGLGSLGLVAGWLLLSNGRTAPTRQGDAAECTSSFVTGTIFYLTGIALYLVQYWQVGGYMAAVAMDRGQRFEMLKGTVSMPYEGFVVAGLSLMLYGSLGVSKSRLVFSSGACLVWMAMVLLQGDRRLALQVVLALLVVIGSLRPKVTKLRPLALAAIAGGYIVAVIFGQYRTLIYDLAAGRSTLKQAQEAAEAEDSIMGKPEESELGGPYISVLYYSRGTEPLRWGSSYAMSIPAVVPRALYPGVKAPAISADLDLALWEGGTGPVYGWGFSPIAEGFANFGFVGAFAMTALWSMFFAWLGSYRYCSLAGMVVCATLLQEAVNANRIDFRYVYLECFYCGGVGVLAVLAMKAVKSITHGNVERPRSITSNRRAFVYGEKPQPAVVRIGNPLRARR